MAEDPDRDFFLQPTSATQRQYEALRRVFVDGCSQKEAAQQFGYSYGAFRQLVLQFRTARRAGQAPPFSPRRHRAGLASSPPGLSLP
jgi:transposase